MQKIESRLPRLSRFFWLAVLLVGWLWIRPVVSIPWNTTVQEHRPVVSAVVEPILAPTEFEHPRPFQHLEMATLPEPLSVAPVATIVETKSFDRKHLIFKAVFTVWIGGMVVSIFLAAVGYLQFLMRLRKTRPAGDDFAGPWHRLLEERGIDARFVPMFVSDGRENLGPALIRTVHGYRLVVPRELWSELSEVGRRGILKHELEHFRRRDVWKSFFVRILALPHWFNPVAHLAVHRFEEAAEVLCDRAAFDIRQADPEESAVEFAKTLLLLHENATTQFVARQSIFGRGLQHRVTCLLHKNHKTRISVMKKALLITGAVALFAACLFRIEFVEKIVAKTTEPENSVVASVNPNAMIELRLLVLDEGKNPVPETKVQLKTYVGVQCASALLDLGTTDSQGKLNAAVSAALMRPDVRLSFYQRETGLLGGISPLYDPPKNWQMSKSLELAVVMMKARRMTGVVVDADGKPVSGATVNASFSERIFNATTDETGKFQLDVFPLQPLESLFAFKSGVGAGMISPDFPPEESWKATGDGSHWEEWAKNRNDGPFTIRIERGEKISVRVVDTEGNPIAGINAYPSYFSTKTSFWNTWNFGELFPQRTDQNGMIVFDWIPTRDYHVISFSAQGTDPRIDKESKANRYGAAEAVWREAAKNNDLVIQLPKKVMLEGTVSNADGSPPPVGMQISIVGKKWANCGTMTDDAGNFTFFTNADEIVSVYPIANSNRNPGCGVASAMLNVDVGDGSKPAPRFDFVLENGTKVVGKILSDNPEKPFEKMNVQVFDAAFDRKTELIDMNRLFVVIEINNKGEYETRLSDGVYRFKVDDKEIDGTLEIKGEAEKPFDLKI